MIMGKKWYCLMFFYRMYGAVETATRVASTWRAEGQGAVCVGGSTVFTETDRVDSSS